MSFTILCLLFSFQMSSDKLYRLGGRASKDRESYSDTVSKPSHSEKLCWGIKAIEYFILKSTLLPNPHILKTLS